MNSFGGFGTNRPTNNTFGQPQQTNTFGQPQQNNTFGQPQQSQFGSSTFANPSFGNQQPQQQQSTFGSTFGAQQPQQNTSGFGTNTASTFGQQQQRPMTSGFGQPQTTGFGSTSTFGQPQQQSTFGQPQTTGFGSTSTFGQPAPTTGFGQPSTFNRPSTTGFGTQQSSGFGTQQSSGFNASFRPATTTFNNPSTSSFGGNSLGSSNLINEGTKPFTASHTSDGYYQCITSDKQYENFSLEELRLKDYQLNKKQATAGAFGTQQQPSITGFGGTTSGFGQSTGFGQNQQQPQQPAFGQPQQSTFGQQPTTTTGFGGTSSGFGNSSGFGQKPPTTFGQSTTGFGTTQPTTSFGTTQPSTSGFGATSFNKPATTFGQTQPQQPTTSFGSTQPPTTGFGTTQPSSTGFGTTSSFNKPAVSFNQPQPSAFNNSTFNKPPGISFSTPTPNPQQQQSSLSFSTPLKPATSFGTTQPAFGQPQQQAQPNVSQFSTSFQQPQQQFQTPQRIAKIDDAPYGHSPLLQSPVKVTQNHKYKLSSAVKRQPQTVVSSRYKTQIFTPNKQRTTDPRDDQALDATMFVKQSPKTLNLTPQTKQQLLKMEDKKNEPFVTPRKIGIQDPPISDAPASEPQIIVDIPPEYVLEPPINDILKAAVAQGPSYLCPHLSVTVHGVGAIEFLETINLMNPVNEDAPDEWGNIHFTQMLGKIFNQLIILKPGEIVVYPDEGLTADIGQGLNVRMRIRMENIWPKDKETEKEIKNTEHPLFKKFKWKLEALKTQKYIGYENGVWEYELENLGEPLK